MASELCDAILPLLPARKFPLAGRRVSADAVLLVRPNLLHLAFRRRHSCRVRSLAWRFRYALHGGDPGQRADAALSRPDRRQVQRTGRCPADHTSARCRSGVHGDLPARRASGRDDLSAPAVRPGHDDPHRLHRNGTLVRGPARTRSLDRHAGTQCGRGAVASDVRRRRGRGRVAGGAGWSPRQSCSSSPCRRYRH